MWSLIAKGIFYLFAAGIIWLGLFRFADAFAHDWYDQDCCNNRDCREAHPDEVVERDGGYWIESSQEHFAYDNPRVRPMSPDGKYHVCQWKEVRHYGQNFSTVGKVYTRCLYTPSPGS